MAIRNLFDAKPKTSSVHAARDRACGRQAGLRERLEGTGGHIRGEGFEGNPGYEKLLRDNGIGNVVADTAGLWPYLDAVTSGVVYVRLHGDTELYVSGYSDEALHTWAERVRAWSRVADVVVYFDNDVKVHAPFDAMRLAQMLGVGSFARHLYAIAGFLGFVDQACARWVQNGCPPDERDLLLEAALGALEGGLGDWRV